jgi:hypothetical protein
MKLDEYLTHLENMGIPLYEIAFRLNISRESLAKYRDEGFPSDPSGRTLGLARKIVKATKGKVTLKDLGIS